MIVDRFKDVLKAIWRREVHVILLALSLFVAALPFGVLGAIIFLGVLHLGPDESFLLTVVPVVIMLALVLVIAAHAPEQPRRRLSIRTTISSWALLSGVSIFLASPFYWTLSIESWKVSLAIGSVMIIASIAVLNTERGEKATTRAAGEIAYDFSWVPGRIDFEESTHSFYPVAARSHHDAPRRSTFR